MHSEATFINEVGEARQIAPWHEMFGDRPFHLFHDKRPQEFIMHIFRLDMPSFVDREAATELGVRPARWELLFFLLLGLVVAAASKVAGALMVFCYLIAPAAAALLLVRRLWSVLILAAVLAVTSTLSGLWLSFRCDWPTNQTVCLVACVLLPVTGLALAVRRLFRWQA